MIKYCTNCLFPSTKPDLLFNNDGICNACTNYWNRPEINWESRSQEFKKIVKWIKSTNYWDCVIPVSGGIKKLKQIEKLLSIGADKISINTISYYDDKFIKEAVYNFGSQCIVGSIDYRLIENKRICFSHSGQKNENKELENWISELEQLGVGELLITPINLDGTMNGYDIEMLEKIATKVSLPIICSGGCGSYEDMLKAIKAGSDGVAAASIFHFTELTPYGAKLFLSEHNIPIRS